MNTPLANKLAARQEELVLQIIEQKSAISNIELQLGRKDPADDDEDDKKWRAQATYARDMKKGELLKMENDLENVKSARKDVEQVSGDKTSRGSMTAVEFVAVAKRRLQSDVYMSIMEEAEQSVQDALYDAVQR